MKTFTKELQYLREKVNSQYENDKTKKITYQKILEHCPLPDYEFMSCNIESINFRNHFLH